MLAGYTGMLGVHIMSTLFAFLHHLAAFTLVAAIAVEFTLIRQELTLASARKLQATDMGADVLPGSRPRSLRQLAANRNLRI